MKLNNKGFTLVEMVVVTAIFVVVIMITGSAFKTILSQTAKLYKSEESNIEGVVGLEMFRHDLEQAGFGLPDSYQNIISYNEAQNAPANQLNDAPSAIPRPFVTIEGDTTSGLSDSNSETGNTYTILSNAMTNTDYLSIKATSLGMTPATQKWTYLTYTSAGNVKQPQTWSATNFNNGDLVTVLRRTFQTGGGVSNQLVMNGANYNTSYNPAVLSGQPFTPTMPGDTFYFYGVLDQPATALRMPFNRVDYFVANPSNLTKFPTKTCAPYTGILYKATVDHGSGNLIYTPILDCVADMQVVLGWDLVDASGNIVTDPTLTGDGQIDTWTNADGTTFSSSVSTMSQATTMGAVANPGHIKTKLKIIKVYILAQNGRKDPSYTSPASIAIGDPGEMTLTKKTSNGNYNLDPSMLNYRWKLYRLVIKPKNLISNQQ